MELDVHRKDEERQGAEVKNQRFTMQEMARGFSLFEKALLGFWDRFVVRCGRWLGEMSSNGTNF